MVGFAFIVAVVSVVLAVVFWFQGQTVYDASMPRKKTVPRLRTPRPRLARKLTPVPKALPDEPAALPPQVREQPATLWAGREQRPSLREVEASYIRYVLEQVSGSQTKAASILGISRKALWEKRRRYGIP